MADDPYAAYAAIPEHTRKMIETVAPTLHQLLARTAEDAPPREVRCVFGTCATGPEAVPSAGRISRNGAPACRAHIAKLADRPGGWSLKRIEDRP